MEWAGRIIGAFYLVGGLVVLRQAWLNWRLEQMIVAIAPDARARLGERVADAFMLGGGFLVVASGVALMLLHRWTVVAVLACWGAQAVYLLWAQRWHAPDGPIAFQGRRQSINAFALYSAVAALVLWMNATGALR